MNKNQKSIYEKACLLRDGQIVQISDNWFRARETSLDSDENPCLICQLDSICREEIAEVCLELDFSSRRYWILELANNENNTL